MPDDIILMSIGIVLLCMECCISDVFAYLLYKMFVLTACNLHYVRLNMKFFRSLFYEW